MPDRQDPDGLALDAVEEAMGWHDDFAVGQQRELGQSAPRVGVARQSLENSLSAGPDLWQILRGSRTGTPALLRNFSR